MSNPYKRVEIGPGVHFSSIRDPKFKHNRLSVNLIVPLEEETASANALVPFLLRKGCRSCPDFTLLEQKLCGLYGASLSADASKYGKYQMLCVWIQSIDDRYALDGLELTRECASLLADVVFDPNLDKDGLFPQKDFDLEKAFLLDTIAAEINDKRSYAVARCLENMCAGEPPAIRKYGTMERASALAPADAAAAYRRMLDSASMEIMFVGSGDPAGALETFRALLGGKERPAWSYEPCPRKERSDTPKEVVDQMDVAQGKLVMGLRTGPALPYEKTDSMRMMAALLGGTPMSLLFMNVREKLSLCYYCAARYDFSNGILLIDSGVEAQNKQAAHTEILNQLDVIRHDGFTEDQLEATRLAIVNALRTTGDSLGGIESWYMTQILLGSNISPTQEIARLSQVTRAQVVEAACQVTLDTVYFLSPKEEESEEAAHE